MKKEQAEEAARAGAHAHAAAGASNPVAPFAVKVEAPKVELGHSAAFLRASAAAPPVAKVEDEPTSAELLALLEAQAAQAAQAEATRAAPQEKKEPSKKAEISYALSGKLAAAASDQPAGTELKYQEPPDARMPDQAWRLYVFKGKEQLDEPLRIHRQSFYLIGRDEKACDIVVAHPSCSKQHAVIQFRQREVQRPDGTIEHVIKPYLMDLGSTNGTTLMAIRREPRQYYELFENDLIQFGFSTREYVLLNPDKIKSAAGAKR